MEPELKAYLDKITSQLADMKGDIVGIRDEMSSMETRLREHTETIETKLLTEFWNWAKTAEARFRQARNSVGVFEDRVEAIEDRVSELERRRAV